MTWINRLRKTKLGDNVSINVRVLSTRKIGTCVCVCVFVCVRVLGCGGGGGGGEEVGV